MSKLRYYVRAMRLRTIFLSISGVTLGLCMACATHDINWMVVLWLYPTVIALQLLSNVCNELGDAISGTDNDTNRVGPTNHLTEGKLTKRDFYWMICIYAACAIIFGTLLVWSSFDTLLATEPIALLILGALAIMSAMKYTMGKKPYGYRGFGDLAVFIFFGLASVCGGYYLIAHSLSPTILLPAVTIGCFSVGVLNVNNMRDIESDRVSRTTIPIRIGLKNAKIYQTVLIVIGWSCMVAYTLCNTSSGLNWLYIATLPLYIKHLVDVWRRSGKELDSTLPLLSLSTFLFAILAGVGVVI